MTTQTFAGFTPVPDCIRDDLDLLAAMVFGAVWRFSQLERGQCDASLESIAERAGLGTTTTRIRLRKLTAGGWIVSIERPGKPTVYRDAGRWQLQVVGADTEPQREALPSERTPTPRVAHKKAPQRLALPYPNASRCRKIEELKRDGTVNVNGTGAKDAPGTAANGTRPATASPAPNGARQAPTATAPDPLPREGHAPALPKTKAEPKPQRKPARRTTGADGVPAQGEAPEARLVFGALCTWLGLDWKRLPANTRGKLNKIAGNILAAGLDAATVERAAELWQTDDWRGKRGQAPTFGQLEDLVAAAVDTRPRDLDQIW